MTQMILLMGLGLVLILAEVLIPSMGMLGIAAGVCVIGSVAWGFATSSEIGMNLLLVAAVLVPLMVMLGFKLLPLSPLTKKLIAGGFSFEDGKATDPRDARRHSNSTPWTRRTREMSGDGDSLPGVEAAPQTARAPSGMWLHWPPSLPARGHASDSLGQPRPTPPHPTGLWFRG